MINVLLVFLTMLSPTFAKNFVLFTEPKTGTHLLIPILTELTGKNVYWAKEYREATETLSIDFKEALIDPNYLFFSSKITPWKREMMDKVWKINEAQGTFLHLHAPYSPTMESFLKEKNCFNFFVKRDPRDQVVSLLNHYKNIDFSDKKVEQLSSDDERLLHMIQKDLRSQTLLFMGWLKSPYCCVLDFSKLMGAHGGASTDDEALQEMRTIARALKLNLQDRILEKIYKKHFGTGWNFFKGKVGAWKDYFKEEHKAAAKQEIGDLLIEMGFEQDYNW